jgi:hypothetical protein
MDNAYVDMWASAVALVACVCVICGLFCYMTCVQLTITCSVVVFMICIAVVFYCAVCLVVCTQYTCVVPAILFVSIDCLLRVPMWLSCRDDVGLVSATTVSQHRLVTACVCLTLDDSTCDIQWFVA